MTLHRRNANVVSFSLERAVFFYILSIALGKVSYLLSIERIAELAGVSKATVWAALASRPDVAASTRERVQTIADQIGYRRSGIARALATGRSETIGFLRERSYKAGREWTEKILFGLVETLEKHSYHTMVFHAEPSEKTTPPGLLRRMVDGMVLAVSWAPGFLDELIENNMPVVLADPCDEFECDTVRADDVEGARLAVRHLLELGHRRIAYVASYHRPAGHLNQLRWEGFTEVMAEAGLPVNPGGQRIARTREMLARVFEWDTPTALVCFSDGVVLEALPELRARGLRVPEDISIVGVDDLSYARHITPPLTTVSVPFIEIGTAAARMMLERLENPELEPRRMMLPEELIVRGSTGPPRTDRSGSDRVETLRSRL